jgi:methionyl aminopeptidase
MPSTNMIILKSRAEIAQIRESGRIVAECLDIAREAIRPGARGVDVDRAVEEHIRRSGGEPSFKGYRSYPASTCISVNEQVVHGIPSSVPFREGDIVSFDVGVFKNGYHGDAARTFPVGEVSEEALRLIQVAREGLDRGIAQVRPNAHLSDIGHAIQSHVEGAGFSVVRSLVGHGIGMSMHEEPQIPNFGVPGQGPQLQPGMALAIEPMVNAGHFDVFTLDDGWTVVTRDGSLSVHVEDTVAVTENGHEVLTAG